MKFFVWRRSRYRGRRCLLKLSKNRLSAVYYFLDRYIHQAMGVKRKNTKKTRVYTEKIDATSEIFCGIPSRKTLHSYSLYFMTLKARDKFDIQIAVCATEIFIFFLQVRPSISLTNEIKSGN